MQHCVSHSSIEAEYRAVATSVSEINWITTLLHELQVKPSHTLTAFSDNIGTTYICANPVLHNKTKHVIDFHFVRDQVEQNKLKVQHLHAADQVADILTKTLQLSAFRHHFIKLAVMELPPSLQGRNNTSAISASTDPKDYPIKLGYQFLIPLT